MAYDKSSSETYNGVLAQSNMVSLNGHTNMEMINGKAVRRLVLMSEAINLMEKAFVSLYNGTCYVPLRSVVESQDKSVTVFFKPAFDHTLNRFAIKFLSQNENNKNHGVPTITGIVLLLDMLTGKIISIMDGDGVTSLRTGAISGLATKYLSRPESQTLAVFGCGAQGRTQVEAVLAVRDIKKVYLYDIDKCAGEKMIGEFLDRNDISFEYSEDHGLLKEVDIICTATGSKSPLFSLKHIKKGVHINAIGSYKPDMQELDPDILKASSLYVDQREACLSETGDIIIPLSMGAFTKDHLKGEIGELLTGKLKGRQSADEITVFKSVGVAAQDLYVANAVYENSLVLRNGETK